MELLDVARVLSRRPALVLLGALLALTIALTLGGSGQGGGATATARVLVDTPKSQIVAAKPGGLDTLLWRAGLMANLLSTRENVELMAAAVGVRAADVAVVDPFLETPPTETSLAKAASDAASITAARYVLSVETNDQFPLVTLQAATPDEESAKQFAEAAVALLAKQGARTGTASLQGVVVRDAADLRVKIESAGHGKLVAVAGSIVFFAFWCAALAILPALLEAWRATIRVGAT